MIVTITSMDTLVGGGVKSYGFFNVHWVRMISNLTSMFRRVSQTTM